MKFQSTMIRTNARFRGPTEKNKYFNMVNEAVHDIVLLHSILDGTKSKKGHSDYISDNFELMYNGNQKSAYCTIPTLATIYGRLEKKSNRDDLTSSDWSWTDGTVVSTVDGLVSISKPADNPPSISKMFTLLDVEEGEILYVLADVDSTGTTVRMGSSDINRGEGSYKDFTINKRTHIGVAMRARHKESIHIDIEVIPSGSTVTIHDFQILYLQEEKLTLQPVNTKLKQRINKMESDIHNLLSRM